MFHYTWLETQRNRGSNEITSALYDFIKTFETQLQNENRSKIKLRLFSHACGSQNRNFTVIAMLIRLMEKTKIFKETKHVFPIRGHGYLPPDRVFGNVEKNYSEMESITVPSAYYTVLNKFGKCMVLGEDWDVNDFKTPSDALIKKKKTLLNFKGQSFNL